MGRGQLTTTRVGTPRTTGTKPQRPKEQEGAVSSLNVAIGVVRLAKETSNIRPATATFSSVGVLLTTIRDSMANASDYVELGLFCADICRTLDRGTDGKNPDDLSKSVYGAIEELRTIVAEIRAVAMNRNGRGLFSRLILTGNNKSMIAAWKFELNRILRVFNDELHHGNRSYRR